MNTLKLVQPYLLEPGDSVNPTDRECYRLTSDDKRQIEAAIEKHGAGALENVTKGGAMLYLRFPMRFAGEDEEYLRSLFAPETLKQRPWDGPEQIALNVRDTGKIGVDGKRIQLVETFNPFVERYYRLPYRNMLPPSGDIVGYRFMAMPWRKTGFMFFSSMGALNVFRRECCRSLSRKIGRAAG